VTEETYQDDKSWLNGVIKNMYCIFVTEETSHDDVSAIHHGPLSSLQCGHEMKFLKMRMELHFSCCGIHNETKANKEQKVLESNTKIQDETHRTTNNSAIRIK
jgi:hypothetical protein